MINLTREEQEVIITTCAAGNDVEVYASDPVYIRKLDKLCERHPECYTLKDENEYSKTYKVSSKKLISFRAPREPVEVSEEVKQKRIEGLQRAREIRNRQL